MRPAPVAVVQARMSSTRLPGKVLADLGGRPVIEWVVRRLRASRELAGVVVATSDHPSDDPIEEAAPARVFRGPLDDVLGRYAIAARELEVVTFRGMARRVRVYEVLGTYPLAADAARRLAAFESGLAAWRQQRWPEAKGWFEQVLALAPEDRPSQIYLERCRDRLAGRPEASAAS